MQILVCVHFLEPFQGKKNYGVKGNLKTWVQLYNSQKLSTQMNWPCHGLTLKRCLVTLLKEMKWKIQWGWKTPKEKWERSCILKDCGSRSRWRRTSQRQMLFLNCLQLDLSKHPQKSRHQNPSRLKAWSCLVCVPSSIEGEVFRKKDT